VDIIDHLQAIKKEQLEATAKKEKEKAAQKTETKKEREVSVTSLHRLNQPLGIIKVLCYALANHVLNFVSS